jgi:predicted membrane GTPase involved in stress response
MPFQPGNQEAKKGQRTKLYQQALKMELAAAGDDLKELRAIARKQIDLAKAGDIQAINGIADRLDGKPAQAVIGGEEDDPALQVHHTITRRIVGPGDTNGSGSPATP